MVPSTAGCRADAQGHARGQDQGQGRQDDNDVGAGHSRQVREGGGFHGVGQVGGHQAVVTDCHAGDEASRVSGQMFARTREGPVCVPPPAVQAAGTLCENHGPGSDRADGRSGGREGGIEATRDLVDVAARHILPPRGAHQGGGT